MERPTLEDSSTTAPQRHVQEDLQRNDVPFPYGTDDATSQSTLPYGLRLASTPDATPYRQPPATFASTPVLVTRGSSTKGTKGPLVCHIEGCQRDLTTEKKYYKRYRVCMEHLKMSAICVDGELQRFCQQCGRFHDLSKFDGEKRNCRERLSQHNRRRRKSKREPGQSDGSEDLDGEEPSGKAAKGRRSKRLVQKTTSPSLWTNAHPGYDDGTHGMTSEEQNALGTVGMEMMHGIPVSVSTGLHPYGSGMALSPADGQPTTQERESLFNMVVHHVMPNGPADGTPPVDVKIPLPTDPAVSAASAVSIGVATSGTEHNLTKLLQVSEPIGAVVTQNEASQAMSTPPSLVGVQNSVDMLQSVCAAPGNSMPKVPMLVFPSASAPHQLSAVAIIPSATSSCSTIVPLPWQGANVQPAVQPTASLPPPDQAPAAVDPPPSSAGESNEIPPLVSLALSASGIAQAAGSNAYHPSISPNQLAHFQMLMARQIATSQATPLEPSDIVIPEATVQAVRTHHVQKEEKKEIKDEKHPPSPSAE